MPLRVLDRHRRTGQVRGFGSTEQRARYDGRRRGAVRQEFQKIGWLASVPQTFETLQAIPPGGTKIDFPARIAQTRSARNHPRRIANGTQMSHSLQ
jgi:hypothetical protein